MSKDLTKKATEMLLNGATLLSEPCPYCSGVRVMKQGHALCISCGREPEKREKITENNNQDEKLGIKERLEKKMDELTEKLEHESDLVQQQEILKSINSLIETIGNLKKQ